MYMRLYLLRAPESMCQEASYFWGKSWPAYRTSLQATYTVEKLNTATQCRSTSPSKVIIPPESVRKSSALNTHLFRTGVSTLKGHVLCAGMWENIQVQINVIMHQRFILGKEPFVYQSGKSFRQTQLSIRIKNLYSFRIREVQQMWKILKPQISPRFSPEITVERIVLCAVTVQKSFYHSFVFIGHKRVFSRERPYRCSDCVKSFTCRLCPHLSYELSHRRKAL